MAEPEYPISAGAIFVPIAASLVLILDIPPLLWHVRNVNLGASSLVIWMLIFNLFALTNALIWPRDNVDQWFSGHGLCDFEIYVAVAGWVGIPSSLLCVMRTLSHVLDTTKVAVRLPRAHRVRQFAIDWLICWAPPIIQICTFDIVKACRYAVKGFNGCMPVLDTSWVSFVLVYIQPLLICMVTAYYAVLVLVRLHRYRTEFSQLIRAHNTTSSRFVRLFLLSSLFVLGILPTQSVILYVNTIQQATNYSWARNHDPANRATVLFYKANGTLTPDRWVGIVCGLLLFFFFGLGTDAAAMYRSWLTKLNPLSLFRRGHKRSSSGPSSPSRSVFSCKTYLTATTTSTAKSILKPSLTFWRSSTHSEKAVLPVHNSSSTASAAPTIETAISTTPLSRAIRKASNATFTDKDLDDVTTLLGSPALDEKMVESGLGIELGVINPKAAER